MPASFPEMWLSRVIAIVTTLTTAPWLDGISELETQVIEVGTGTTSESNLIHIPIENFEVDCLINNTTYPIPAQAFDDDDITIQLDKYNTKVTTLSDDQIDGASYNKIDSATKAHTRSILKNKFKKAIHALAPLGNTANTPVLEVTGPTINGRDTMRYEDLVALKRKLDDMDCPEEDRRLVLSTDHWNDMLLDKERFANLLVNHNTGKLAPVICGFEIYSYLGNPYYDTNLDKLPFGQVPISTDRKASVAFYKENVAKKTGKTKQYFEPSSGDTAHQTNRLNYRHYFITLPVQQKWMAAIV
jgi:hypothetical protein